MIAAVAELDLARLLLDLLIVVVAAKVVAELAERIGVPAVLGEIVAGIVIGPSVLGLIELGGADRAVSLGVIAEIGVLLLLVQVGMAMDLAELGRVGRAALLVALVGVTLPFAMGAGAMLGLGEGTDTAIFLGAALTATSVGITARVFGDLRALATTEARVVLGAAVADDVIGLLILTVVVEVVGGGGVTMSSVGSTLAWALGFLVLGGVVTLLLVPRAFDVVHRLGRSSASLTVAALAVVLGLALLADAAQLAFIIGAFMAGLAIGRSGHRERIAHDLDSVAAVFVPVFFVLIGVNADLGAMVRGDALLLAAALFAVAVIGKLLSGAGAIGVRADRTLIGIGMLPRGEVGLIFASIGLSRGVLDDRLYGALLLVVLLTTVVTPPLLRWRVERGGDVRPADAETEDETSVEPAHGWVEVRDGSITLAGAPPAAAIVAVALQAAALIGKARPSDELLDWLAARRHEPLSWTYRDSEALLGVLHVGDPRAIRFLDVTGVLERALPDVAAAVERRRHDPGELDPTHPLRFPVVARLDELVAELGPAERGAVDALLFAGVVLDVTGTDPSPTQIDSILAQLAVEGREPVRAIVGGARLLASASADLDSFEPSELRQIATHLGSTSTADAAYLLALASGARHRGALDELHRRMTDLLAHPELLGPGADSLAEVRRRHALALATEQGARDRLAAAPGPYLLSHEPDELARQARLVEPLPRSGVVRVAVSPEGRPEHWIVDVAARDVEGLLARLARALTDAGADIVTANVATWPDGGAVDTFIVRSAVRPRARALAERMEGALARRVELEPIAHVDVDVDDASLPWHTAVTVTGVDRPGALSAIAAAFSAAGVTVHGARLATSGTRFSGRFSVTDRHGRKLDGRAVQRLRDVLAGARPRRGLFAGRQ